MQVGERSGDVDEAKAGGERQYQEQRNAIAIDPGPSACERTGGPIKSESLDGVQYNAAGSALAPAGRLDHCEMRRV